MNRKKLNRQWEDNDYSLRVLEVIEKFSSAIEPSSFLSETLENVQFVTFMRGLRIFFGGWGLGDVPD